VAFGRQKYCYMTPEPFQLWLLCRLFVAFGLLAFWPFGLLAFWPFGLLAFWPFGLLAFGKPGLRANPSVRTPVCIALQNHRAILFIPLAACWLWTVRKRKKKPHVNKLDMTKERQKQQPPETHPLRALRSLCLPCFAIRPFPSLSWKIKDVPLPQTVLVSKSCGCREFPVVHCENAPLSPKISMSFQLPVFQIS
jgi:hypothetical protein